MTGRIPTFCGKDCGGACPLLAVREAGRVQRLERGLSDGGAVLVYNQRGRVRATARISADIRPGVVCLHQGVGADLAPDGTDRAGSANLLTGTEGSGPAAAPVMHAVAVTSVAGLGQHRATLAQGDLSGS